MQRKGKAALPVPTVEDTRCPVLSSHGRYSIDRERAIALFVHSAVKVPPRSSRYMSGSAPMSLSAETP